MMLRLVLLTTLATLPVLTFADASRPGTADALNEENPGPTFKLTPSYYATTRQKSAFDINLRANYGPHAVWIGQYQRANEFEQTRSGYELTLENAYGRLVPSIQVATHGFLGNAVNLEIGKSFYALIGAGRTNTRDYYNLNFDPNDSTTVGVGMRQISNLELLAYNVRDNRLHTGQSVSHLIGRYHISNSDRLTLDLFQKHGRASEDEPMVTGKGVAATWDHGHVFVRAALDHKVNFTDANQFRLSLGGRF